MAGICGEMPIFCKPIWIYSKFMMVTLLLAAFYIPLTYTHAQVINDQIEIGADGIMRWHADGKELTGFGVNYTVPFAHAYRSGKKLGVDLKKAIDQDVYQFARLGLDLYRVHVWDCEISDSLGNLIDNEHLELFDYLLFRLQEHGINAIITPIAYWGNGWPDPDEPTPGFSSKYGKAQCLVDPGAIKAQENYLAQFVNHVNRYTGVSYKYYKNILAFEISNEPHHQGSAQEVTSFVTRMKNAIRSTSCTKPVFYNVSHSIHLADAYFKAGIDGGTFQWYPTGLGFQKELGGNMLPNVDSYAIPFDNIMKNKGAARIVYEFDAADMASSYMYPAMARSFRTAGIQLATHFSYDPTFLAPYNTEYNTHYMNLFYAPRKALSLMICGEVFRQIPLYADYGHYPDNASFGPFTVSYENDLAELVTADKFIYTNHTQTRPANPQDLRLIAGWGNSPLVEYEGTGAYFLDKVADGAWRLEILPDAIITDNLFGRNSLDKPRAALRYEQRKIRFHLPGFENGFSLESLTMMDDMLSMKTAGHEVALKPGVYLLTSPAYENDIQDVLTSITKFDWKGIGSWPEGAANPVKEYSSARTNGSATSPSRGKTISLFDAATDDPWVNRNWIEGSGLKKNEDDGTSYVSLVLKGLTERDPENPNAPLIADYTLRHYFGDLIAGREKDMLKKKKLIVHASAAGSSPIPVQVSLVMKDGSAFGGMITLDADEKAYTLRLDELKRVKAVILPRPYPTFLPYFSEAGKATKLDLNQVESLQLSIGPKIPEADWSKTYEIRIGGVLLK